MSTDRADDGYEYGIFCTALQPPSMHCAATGDPATDAEMLRRADAQHVAFKGHVVMRRKITAEPWEAVDV